MVHFKAMSSSQSSPNSSCPECVVPPLVDPPQWAGADAVSPKHIQTHSPHQNFCPPVSNFSTHIYHFSNWLQETGTLFETIIDFKESTSNTDFKESTSNTVFNSHEFSLALRIWCFTKGFLFNPTSAKYGLVKFRGIWFWKHRYINLMRKLVWSARTSWNTKKTKTD